MHFYHIILYSRGGSSLVAENIQLMCARHNLAKHDKICSRIAPPPGLAAGEALVHPDLLVGVLHVLGETLDRVPVPAGVADEHRHSGGYVEVRLLDLRSTRGASRDHVKRLAKPAKMPVQLRFWSLLVRLRYGVGTA